MTKVLVFLIIVITAGGLFVYTKQAMAPTPEEQAAQQERNENPFGQGSAAVGPFDDSPMPSDSSSAGSTGTPDEGTATTGTPIQETGGSGSTGAPQPGTQAGVITRAELAKHNKQADCWIAYKGVVYDVTNWLPRHPGSAAAIAPYCGTAEEFAAAFNGQHGTSKEGRLQQEGVKEGTLGN